MDNSEENTSAKLPRVALISHYNTLTVLLAQKLLENSFEVEIFTNQINLWEKGIKEEQLSLKINNLKEEVENPFEYIVSLNINAPQEDFDKDFLLDERQMIVFAARVAKKYSSKCVFAFPFVQKTEAFVISYTWIKELLDDRNLFAGALYLGEVMFSSNALIGNNGLAKALEYFLKNTPIIIPKDEKYFYPIEVNDAVNEIIRSLFSLRAYGVETAIICRPLPVEEIFTAMKKLKPESKLFFTDETRDIKTPVPKDFIYKNFDYENFLSQLTKRFVEKELATKKETPQQIKAQTPAKQEIQITKTESSLSRERAIIVSSWLGLNNSLSRAIKSSRAPTKLFYIFITLVIIFFAGPWLLLEAGFSSLATAKKAFEKGNTDVTEKSLKISQTVSWVSGKQSLVLVKLPVLGNTYRKLANTSLLITKISRVGLRALSLIKNVEELSSRIVDEASIDGSSVYARKISLDLDSLYKELGFLEGDINYYQNFSTRKLKRALGDINISEIRQKIVLLEKISDELPVLLGKGRPATYLILFQNSSRLSPTGGSVDAFGLLTFSDGKLTDSKVYSSAFADRLLKGYVEPPEPIKKYFGEKVWYLKDSNWDPDFSVSAAKAEWFIDKEMDRSVDGVIGIDLEFIKTFLKQTGSLSISKSGNKVTSENLYELIQEPQGLGKENPIEERGSFFSKISQEFLTKILKINPKDKIVLSKDVAKNLEERHIQIFLHNVQAQRALSDLRWAGEVYQLGCKGNCYSDLFGIVEANPKDSTPNLPLKKEVDLMVSFEKGLIKRKLTVFFDNSSQGRLSGKYKSYVRVLAPEDSGFGPVDIIDGQTRKSVDPEVYGIRGHKEAGVLVEVSVGDTKALVFSWESGTKIDLDQKGEYFFYLRKQGGVLNYPIEAKFNIPENIKVTGAPTFSLTGGDFVGYNTLLSRDFVSRIFW